MPQVQENQLLKFFELLGETIQGIVRKIEGINIRRLLSAFNVVVNPIFFASVFMTFVSLAAVQPTMHMNTKVRGSQRIRLCFQPYFKYFPNQSA
jgi:hypothetical protein